jgi:hypothetical protein
MQLVSGLSGYNFVGKLLLMNQKITGLVAACCLAFSLQAQSDSPYNYRNFPVVVTLQFHSLTLPFRDMKFNFSNVGFGLGTEVSLNGKHNWAQQLSAIWYRNKAVGNGLFFYTQTAWRPGEQPGVYGEIKAGAGYLVSFRPVQSYKPANGAWVSAGRKGKGMLTIPVGISGGYDPGSSQTYLSPFISYQFLLLSGYSKSIPIVPETLIQAGSRIHFKN